MSYLEHHVPAGDRLVVLYVTKDPRAAANVVLCLGGLPMIRNGGTISTYLNDIRHMTVALGVHIFAAPP